MIQRRFRVDLKTSWVHLSELFHLFYGKNIQQPFRNTDFGAATVVFAAACVGVAVLLLDHPDPVRLQHFLPEHVQLFAMVDSHPQRIAFFSFFFSVVIGCIAMLYVAGRTDRVPLSQRVLLRAFPMLVGTLVVVAAAMNWRQSYRIVAEAIVIILLTYVLARNRHAATTFRVGTAILLVLAIVPGLLGTPLINVTERFIWSDIHYAAVLSHGESLAEGRGLFVDNVPVYGVLIPTLIALVAKFLHVPSIDELMRLVQVGQSLGLVAFLVATWLRTRGSAGVGRVLAMFVVTLAIVPWLGNLGLAIWYPNQSGLRFLMVPVAAIVACLLENSRLQIHAAVIGATVGVAVLWNLETGIAITAGLGMGWLMRVRRERLSTIISYSAIGLVAVSAILGTFVAIYHFNFGGLPFPDSFESGAAAIRSFGSGFGGLKLEFNPLAALILLHAAYVFTRALRSLFDSRSEPPDLTTASIATLLLVFFPYYVNRPDWWNLWVPTAMYSVMIAPMIASQATRIVLLAIVTFVILPPSLTYARQAFNEPLERTRYIVGWKTGCADGWIVPENVCQRLRERAATLKRMVADGDVIWSTGLPMLTKRMTGLPGSVPEKDMFQSTLTDAAFDALVARIQRLKPHAVLLDDPHDPVLKFLPQTHVFNARLMRGLSPGYCAAEIIGGWQVVRRSAPDSLQCQPQ